MFERLIVIKLMGAVAGCNSGPHCRYACDLCAWATADQGVAQGEAQATGVEAGAGAAVMAGGAAALARSVRTSGPSTPLTWTTQCTCTCAWKHTGGGSAEIYRQNTCRCVAGQRMCTRVAPTRGLVGLGWKCLSASWLARCCCSCLPHS